MARNSSSKTKSKHARRMPVLKSAGKHVKQQQNVKQRGPTEDEVVKTKSMQEVNGFPGLQFDDDLEVTDVTDMPEVVEVDTTQDDLEKENSLWITQRGKKKVIHDGEEDTDEGLLQFSKEDTQDEEATDKEAVFNAGHFMFDNKPLIVRAWTAEVELTKGNIKDVPAWIRIHELPLRFWGKCLPAIAGLVGAYQKSDQATMDKTRLGYARVMVELTVGNKFPSKIRFKDENGNIVALGVEYEWKPSICTKCKGIGHEISNCRKDMKPQKKPVQTVQVWRPVKIGGSVSTSNKSTNLNLMVTQQPVNGESASTSLVTPDKSYREAAEGPVTPKNNVKWFLHNKGIGLFGLLETKINPNKTQSVSASMLDGWSVTTNASYHKGGRVWLLWKAELFDVFVLQYDAQFVHALLTERCSQEHFYITLVYAFNDVLERRDLWKKLILIHGAVTGPWVVAGDFNTVITLIERLGGNTKQSDMDEFIDCLATCELTDIHTTGAFYKWTNKQEAQTRVYSRLDRFLINQDWL
ncbi:uncharacterized protein LOC141637213 [Silene latifolia]|uniref:uncharacterized protein LOC141637213 n=1 Tax=Silene latifolia TaxID=37657 RepID=UPI003D77D19E